MESCKFESVGVTQDFHLFFPKKLHADKYYGINSTHELHCFSYVVLMDDKTQCNNSMRLQYSSTLLE